VGKKKPSPTEAVKPLEIIETEKDKKDKKIQPVNSVLNIKIITMTKLTT